MNAIYNDRTYSFRKCDTEGLTPERLQALVDKYGRMQYEPSAAWLVVKGVGYGWEAEN